MVLVFWDTNQNCNPAPLWPLDTLTHKLTNPSESLLTKLVLSQWPRKLFLTGPKREIPRGHDRPIQPARVANQNIHLHQE